MLNCTNRWFCSLHLFMIYWFGLYVGFIRCSYNHEIGCVMFCHVAKHKCSVLCDISCWLKMKYLRRSPPLQGKQVLKWSYTSRDKLSVRKYSCHMKNRKSSTIIANLRDKCPNLLLARYNSVAMMQVFRLLKWAQVITEMRNTRCRNIGQWTGRNGVQYPWSSQQ